MFLSQLVAIQALLPAQTLVVDLADPMERSKHLADPSAFLDLCRALPADRQAHENRFPTEDLVKVNPGGFFEQWVGIELWKRLQYLGEGKLFHLRTKDGAEVDCIIERGGTLTPIEVKWTERPTVQDARHLLTFLEEHPNQAKHGYFICRCSHPLRIHDRITAMPWFCL